MKYICSKCGHEEPVTTKRSKCECGGLFQLDYDLPDFNPEKALSSLNAGRAFDVLHAHYRDALDSGQIMRAISLYKPISMRLHDLKLELLEAHRNNYEEKVQELVAILDDYDKYLVTAEEAEMMGILRNNTNHPEKLQKASIFLYENTDFFRPTLTIKDEYATDSQVHVWMAKPGKDIRYQHNYDEGKLEGRIFTGYRRTDGLFRKGEYPDTLSQP